VAIKVQRQVVFTSDEPVNSHVSGEFMVRTSLHFMRDKQLVSLQERMTIGVEELLHSNCLLLHSRQIEW